MILKNESHNGYIAIVNGIEYPLNKKSSISIDATKGTEITIKSTKKDTVHFDIFAIILGVFTGDDTVTFINTDYNFSVENDCDCITLLDNNWNPRSQLGINACYADSNVTNESYSMPNIKKTKRKHKFIHLYVSSFFLVQLALVILCFLIDPPYICIVFFILIFFVFTLPSFKEIKRFKKATEANYVSDKLCEYAKERRNNGTNYNEDTSKTGKLIGKILDKMFKFDEDK